MTGSFKAALCAAVAMCATNADAATFATRGYVSDVNFPSISFQKLATGSIVNSVTYSVAYSYLGTFATTSGPAIYTYNGTLGSLAFGLVGFDGIGSTEGPGPFSVSGMRSVAGVLTTDLDRFVGSGETFSALVTGGVTINGLGAQPTGRGFTAASYDIWIDYTPAVAAVPEPTTWALMLAGFGLVGYAMRRRRARSVTA
jgi:hypothetical protein